MIVDLVHFRKYVICIGPKDIWPNGHMVERQMTEWRHARKKSDRKDISPKGLMAEKHRETDIWLKRYLTQETQD